MTGCEHLIEEGFKIEGNNASIIKHMSICVCQPTYISICIIIISLSLSLSLSVSLPATWQSLAEVPWRRVLNHHVPIRNLERLHYIYRVLYSTLTGCSLKRKNQK